jgi:hypothetical protein
MFMMRVARDDMTDAELACRLADQKEITRNE